MSTTSTCRKLSELLPVAMRNLIIRTIRQRRSDKIKSMCEELRTGRRKPPAPTEPGETAGKCPFGPTFCLTVRQQARPFPCERLFDGKIICPLPKPRRRERHNPAA